MADCVLKWPPPVRMVYGTEGYRFEPCGVYFFSRVFARLAATSASLGLGVGLGFGLGEAGVVQIIDQGGFVGPWLGVLHGLPHVLMPGAPLDLGDCQAGVEKLANVGVP